MVILLLVILAGILGDAGTMVMYLAGGGHHPGWLTATRWVNRAMLTAGLALIMLMIRAEAGRRQPPS